jgi:hypothetical protein
MASLRLPDAAGRLRAPPVALVAVARLVRGGPTGWGLFERVEMRAVPSPEDRVCVAVAVGLAE